MDIRYDIGQIFQLAFGINSPVYLVNPIGFGRNYPIDYTGVEILTENEAEEESLFGTPIMFPIVFKEGTYQIYDAKGRLSGVNYDNFRLPAATLVDFSRAKNITRTNVLGSNGTVKEIFGFDDWKIRMRGICLAEKDLSEKEQIEKILEWEQIAGSIEVEGDLFKDKEIFSLVIEDINIKQLQAKPGVIPFEITASSDQAIELILSDD